MPFYRRRTITALYWQMEIGVHRRCTAVADAMMLPRNATASTV